MNDEFYFNIISDNLVYNCRGDGIHTGGTSSNDSSFDVYNNTVYNCRRAFFHEKALYVNLRPQANLKNNIAQKSAFDDYVEQYAGSGNDVTLDNCISEDGSSWGFPGNDNQKNTPIYFSDPDISQNFELDVISDTVAIDNAIDLRSDSNFSFDIDIRNAIKEDGAWDIGAFESSNLDAGINDLLVGPVRINGNCNASDNISTLTLYLREPGPNGNLDKNFRPDIYPEFQKIYIEGAYPQWCINAYLLGNNIDNVIIYVQGGAKFGDTFNLLDRGSATVTILTDPYDANEGPASLIYTGPIVNDASKQSKLTFEQIKIYSDDLMSQSYLINNTALTSKIVFINSIIQLNNDAVVDSVSTLILAENSLFLYRNNTSYDNLYIAKNNQTGFIIANCEILTYYNYDISFKMNSTDNVNNKMINCLGYNYGAGFSFDDVSTELSNTIIEDPELMYFTLTEHGFDISNVMNLPFYPKTSSPLINSGDNNYVKGYPYNSTFTDAIIVDIIENDRIFNYGVVDIGPYESMVMDIEFSPNEIQSITQHKLQFDPKNKRYTEDNGSIVYKDLYGKFEDNVGYREEFVREAKVILKLKEFSKDYILYSDKKNIDVCDFEAYYDNEMRSIIITKSNDTPIEFFNSIFDNDQYLLYFNEIENRLYVYLNHTYNKGLSGTKNLIRNMKFGGPSIVSK